MSGVSKAFFWGYDGGETFEVQYNPKELKFDKPVSWKEHDNQGKAGTLEFQKVTPATVQIELVFDTTKDNSDVRDVWINKLLSLTNPIVSPSTGESAEMGKKRPPLVRFYWGDFEFFGVIEDVNASFIMFHTNGNPLRAKVTVKMKEWTPKSNYASGGDSEGYDSESVQLVQLAAGQTISSLAAQYGTTAQAIGDANNLADLMDVPAGTSLMVPLA